MKLVFDVEADNLVRKATKIWCLCAINIDTKKEIDLVRGETLSRRSIIQILGSADTLIGHNIIGYDFKLLYKLYGWEPRKDQEIIDTLVWSKLFNPDRPPPPGYKGKARHSVEAWAIRLGCKEKVQNDVWDRYDPIILQRCKSDVKIQEQIYYALLKEKER